MTSASDGIGQLPQSNTVTPGTKLMVAVYDASQTVEANKITQAPYSAPLNAQVFSASGTWTKPANAQSVRVICIGPGGGGGSGGSIVSGTASSGGGSGGGGAYADVTFPASALPSTVSVNVPAGGLGGTTVTNAAGNNGAAALSNTTFGTFLTGFSGGGGQGGASAAASGGGGGAGANAVGQVGAAGTGGAGGGMGGAAGGSGAAGAIAAALNGGSGGGGCASGTAGSNGGAFGFGGGGGGAGGGLTAAPAATQGGNSGLSNLQQIAAVPGGGVQVATVLRHLPMLVAAAAPVVARAQQLRALPEAPERSAEVAAGVGPRSARKHQVLAATADQALSMSSPIIEAIANWGE